MTDQVTRRALLIGVDEYSKLAARYQLKGCVNDVNLMSDVLRQRYGFERQNVKVLRNNQATRDGILKAMDDLVRRVGPDDIVIIHFSGHGSQVRDREGDEPDGYDETIVPHDSGRGQHPNRDITDDEIYARLLRLSEATPYITLVFDCCHSGTIARDAFGAADRWVETDRRPVEELPPSTAPAGLMGATRDLGPSGWLPLSDRYVLVAGCRDAESSYEHHVHQGSGSTTQGALTYFFCQELLHAEAGSSYRDVFERASTRVTAAHSRQHPQMEGARDREVFGVRDATPMRFVRVTRRAGDTAALAAGAAHGMTVGSLWTVYPQATKRVDEDTVSLGEVEITSVQAVSSQAKVVSDGEGQGVVADSRAVETAHQYGEMRLLVDLRVPRRLANIYRDKIAGLIEDSPMLRLADSVESADARVYLLPVRNTVEGDDPAPQVGPLGAPAWAVVGQDGRLMMGARQADAPQAAAAIRDNLVRLARYRQVLGLSNPDADNPLQGKVTFNLLRQTANGGWAVVEAEEGGHVAYQSDERIAIEVTNQSDQPVYVSVLDFGLTKGIDLLYPVAGANEALAPGRTMQFGKREGEELTLFIPEAFYDLADAADVPPSEGTEVYKMIATTHPTDFGPLVQAGIRGEIPRGDGDELRGIDSPLAQLLTLAMTGQGTRETRPNRTPPDQAWTTVEREFTLRSNETPGGML